MVGDVEAGYVHRVALAERGHGAAADLGHVVVAIDGNAVAAAAVEWVSVDERLVLPDEMTVLLLPGFVVSNWALNWPLSMVSPSPYAMAVSPLSP